MISFLSDKSDKNGNSFWKVNNSLVYDVVYVEKMKKIVTKIYNSNEIMENAQTKWEFLKYAIRKFTIGYSKTITKKGKKRGLI